MEGEQKEREWFVVAVEGVVEDNDVETLEEGRCEVGEKFVAGDVEIMGDMWSVGEDMEGKRKSEGNLRDWREDVDP